MQLGGRRHATVDLVLAGDMVTRKNTSASKRFLEEPSVLFFSMSMLLPRPKIVSEVETLWDDGLDHWL
jgi:hypothetical protein